jgi:hypothetical protein
MGGMQGNLETLLDEMVEAGTITQEQADEILEELPEGGMGGRFAKGGMFGGGFGGWR